MKVSSLMIICAVVASAILLFGSCNFSSKQETDNEPLAKSMMEEYFTKKINSREIPDIKKFAYMDSLLLLAPEKSGRIMEQKAKILINSGRFKEAISALMKIDKEVVSPLEKIDILYNLAYCHQATGDYSKALDNIASTLLLQVPDSLEQHKIDCKFLLARIYRISGNYHRSDSIFKEVRQQIKNLKTSKSRKDDLAARYHIERSSAYLDNQQHKESLEQLKMASNYKMNRETELLIEMGMAELYNEMDKPDIAEDYYKSYLRKAGPSINRIYALYNYAKLLESIGRHEEAADSCRRLIEYTENDGINHVKGAAYEVLSKALFSLGLYKDAYEAHSTFYSIMDSVLWQTGTNLTDDFEKRMALSGKNRPSTDSFVYNHKQDFITEMAIAAAIALACIISLAFIPSMTASKRNRGKGNSGNGADAAENEDPSSQSELITEPVSMSLKLIHANKIIDEISAIACDMSVDNDSRRKQIADILKSRSSVKDFWELFTISFEKVHPDFFRSLYYRHPYLSPGESRMCAFIIMNMSTKEIASLTNRSVRTIDSIKYRLHKRLGLDSGTSTESYLRSLL